MSRTMQRWFHLVSCAVLLAGTGASATNNDNFKFCYSPAFAGWRNFLEPCIDGTIDGTNASSCPLDNGGGATAGKPEEGWANGFRYTVNNGGATPDIVFLALANGDSGAGTLHLDLGVQVKNDKTFDNEDLVVFAFQFPGGKYGALTINPIARNSGAVTPPQASLVKYYTASSLLPGGQPNWGSAISGPDFITYAATSTGDVPCMNGELGSCTWDVEIKVKISAGSANTGAGNMPIPQRTYAGVSRVYHVGSSITDTFTEEFAWPPTNPNGDTQFLFDTVNGVPPPADWGLDFVNSTAGCNGLSFGPGDISVTPSPKVGTTSTLRVNVHNNSIDGSTGAAIAANGVVAQFLHAPFGSSAFGAFQPAGAASAPVNIPASSGGTAVTSTWTPSTASTHECILCRLSSSTNGVTFVNAGEFINTAVAPMSTATVSPLINMAGVSPRVGGGPQKVRVASQQQYQFAFADGTLAEIPAGTLVAQLNWIFLLSHDTGRKITIAKSAIPILEPLPGYGINYQHALLADFQKAFETRHAKELAVFMRIRGDSPNGVSAQTYRNANKVLAGVDEKPDPKLFSTDVKGLTPVTGASGLFDVEIPEGGQVTIPTSGTYTEGGTGTGGCFQCLQTKSTPAFLLFTGSLMGLAGFFAHRKKKS